MNYANKVGWTDVTPFEVVRKVSDKTLDIRKMSSELDPTWVPNYEVGGFSAHCTNNNSQRWIISTNPSGEVVRIRKHRHGGWKDVFGGRYVIADQPQRFRDHNF